VKVALGADHLRQRLEVLLVERELHRGVVVEELAVGWGGGGGGGGGGLADFPLLLLEEGLARVGAGDEGEADLVGAGDEGDEAQVLVPAWVCVCV
jgi:hypothetical protein